MYNVDEGAISFINLLLERNVSMIETTRTCRDDVSRLPNHHPVRVCKQTSPCLVWCCSSGSIQTPKIMSSERISWAHVGIISRVDKLLDAVGGDWWVWLSWEGRGCFGGKLFPGVAPGSNFLKYLSLSVVTFGTATHEPRTKAFMQLKCFLHKCPSRKRQYAEEENKFLHSCRRLGLSRQSYLSPAFRHSLIDPLPLPLAATSRSSRATVDEVGLQVAAPVCTDSRNLGSQCRHSPAH